MSRMSRIHEVYEEIMQKCYYLEDLLEYDETPVGREFGKIVNRLQKFNPTNQNKDV